MNAFLRGKRALVRFVSCVSGHRAARWESIRAKRLERELANVETKWNEALDDGFGVLECLRVCEAQRDRLADELRELKKGFDLVGHLYRQREFSARTFGPGQRTSGVVDHIRKELVEIEAEPTDLSEWIDVVLLALDGAWRHGGTPESIAATLAAKQAKNEARIWPDWRTAAPDKAICHVKTAGEAKS